MIGCWGLKGNNRKCLVSIKLLIILLYGVSVEDVILNNQTKLTNQVVIVLINFPVLLIVQCLEMISVWKRKISEQHFAETSTR